MVRQPDDQHGVSDALESLARDDVGQRWVIEAAPRDLLDAMAGAGLPRAALESEAASPMLAAEASVARLSYPTFFCPQAGPWLAALADLALRGLSFQLAMEERDRPGHLTARIQLFPRLDAETVAALRVFSVPQAESGEAYADRIEQAFALLRREALVGGRPGLLD